jgi:hypothetical protein
VLRIAVNAVDSKEMVDWSLPVSHMHSKFFHPSIQCLMVDFSFDFLLHVHNMYCPEWTGQRGKSTSTYATLLQHTLELFQYFAVFIFVLVC